MYQAQSALASQADVFRVSAFLGSAYCKLSIKVCSALPPAHPGISHDSQLVLQSCQGYKPCPGVVPI